MGTDILIFMGKRWLEKPTVWQNPRAQTLGRSKLSLYGGDLGTPDGEQRLGTITPVPTFMFQWWEGVPISRHSSAKTKSGSPKHVQRRVSQGWEPVCAPEAPGYGMVLSVPSRPLSQQTTDFPQLLNTNSHYSQS